MPTFGSPLSGHDGPWLAAKNVKCHLTDVIMNHEIIGIPTGTVGRQTPPDERACSHDDKKFSFYRKGKVLNRLLLCLNIWYKIIVIVIIPQKDYILYHQKVFKRTCWYAIHKTAVEKKKSWAYVPITCCLSSVLLTIKIDAFETWNQRRYFFSILWFCV